MTSGIAKNTWETVVSLDEAIELDAICDEFESEWQKSGYPSIEEYLSRSSITYRPPLLAELVNVDVYYRNRLGEEANPDDYCDRFPELRSFLHSTAADNATVVSAQAEIPALPATELLPDDVETVGGRRLIEVLGEGSFGSVWRAWNPQLERVEAIKLPRDRSQTRRQLDTFLHEARAAARLKHDNIVRVHDFGEHEQRGYIVFEFIAGTTLSQLRRSQPPDVRRSADICRQLADALAHAHDNDIVHRDIKSSNVMIDSDGIPRLTDFGLARRMDVKSTIAHGGAIMGTIPYMSPEQLEGNRKVDASSDIYSLGIILYELLTGSVPFSGDRSSVVGEILTKSPAPPRLKNRGIPKDLETICLKAISKGKSDRYATAAEFRDDLQRFLNGEPVTARRLSPATRFLRYIRRNPALAAGYAAAFLCAGVAGGVMLNDDDRGFIGGLRDFQGSLMGALQKAKEADPTGIWTVSVTTVPPGATLHFVPRDSDTGEPQPHRDFEAKGTTPLEIDLRPGRYIVTAKLPGTERFHEVERIVPHSDALFPIANETGGKHVMWLRDPTKDQAIDWLPIEIPEKSVTEDMIFIEGTTAFQTGDPDDPDSVTATVDISDFYVSKTEFTAADYLRVKPQAAKSRMFLRKKLQPGQALFLTFSEAVDLAETAGCRLLTENEFEYLARRISVPEAPLATPMTGMLQHRDWDVLPSAPEVKGLLTGLPEWVNAPSYYSLAQHASSEPLEFNPRSVVRGLPLDATEEELNLGALSPFTRQIIPADRITGPEKIAFRLARSVSPSGK